MDRLFAMRAFLRVAEAGSFSAAARQLGVQQPAVSRTIVQLEAHLGVRLLVRSTRRLSLTEPGRRYLEAARLAVEAVDSADEAAMGEAALAAGRVRLAASVAFARRHIVPRLGRLFARHPALDVELVLSDRYIDLIEEGIDVAIRIGSLKDAGLVARRVGMLARATVATPAYWDRKGRPAHPADLAGHDCLLFTGLATGESWHYRGPEGPIAVRVSGRFRTSVSDAMREAVLAGLGVGLTPYWFWSSELADGTLEAVLCGFEPEPSPIQAVYPERRLVSPRVRAVVDFLAGEFRLDPALRSRQAPDE